MFVVRIKIRTQNVRHEIQINCKKSRKVIEEMTDNLKTHNMKFLNTDLSLIYAAYNSFETILYLLDFDC